MMASVAVVTNLFAYDFEVGGLYYRYNYNDYSQVYLTYDDQNNNGYSGNLSIPSNITYNGSGYDVVGIDGNAFSNSYGLSSIYIPSSIRYIGDEYNNSFSQLYYNIPITVSPDNPVLMDHDNAIYSKDMKTLYWMYYSDYSSDSEYSLLSSVELIKRGAMHGQANKLVLPVGLKKIEDYAFNNFYVRSINYQGTLEQYLQIEFTGSAFSNSDIRNIYIQDELLKEVIIPESVTSIPANIFNNIDSIRSVVIPTSVVSIGSGAFNNTAYYKDENNWEGGALYIGDCLIKVKGDVTELVVKEGTRLIADDAAYWNRNLQSVVLPNSLKIIGNSAFYYCQNLTSLNFPDGLTFLGNNALDGTGINLDDDSMYDESGVLYIGKILVKAKNTISGDYQIKDGTASIKENAFYACGNLKSVTIPNSVTNIGSYAFNYCRNLTSVTIPDGVTNIGSYAFYDCDNLTAVTIPASVTSVGSRAFAYCNTLSTVVWNVKKHADFSGDSYYWPFYDTPIKSFVFGDEVEYIPAQICRNMGIQSLIIPDKVTAIGDGAFQYCHSLSDVTIGKNVKTFGTGVFDECKIKSVIWNAKHADDLESIYDNYYGRYCNNLFYSSGSEYNQVSSFEFGNEVERIPANLCCGLQNLITVTIPGSVTSIGSRAFYECSNLNSIHISDIAAWCAIDFEDSPFSGTYYARNTGLYLNDELVTDLVIPDGITSIGNYAFTNCKSLTSVTIPSSVTNIGNQAFSRGSSWSSGDDLVVYFDGNTPPTINSAFDGHTYIIVNDTTPYKASWNDYKSQIFPRASAVLSLDVTANPSMSSIHKKIGDANLENVIDLTLSGTINSYDLMIMRNKMINLRILDLTNTSIEANNYEYYTGIHSENNILRDHAFKNLLSLKLPKTLTLAETVVSECSNLRYLEINGGAVSGDIVSSSNLSVVLNEGVTSISGFREKSGLKSIKLPASLGTIPASAFYNCTGLHSVTMAEGITSIGDNAFKECSQLQSITLPESLTTVGGGAFQGTALKEVFIPSNVTSIGYAAFAPSSTSGSSYYGGHYYTSIQKLQFAQDSKLQSIGSYAFNGCQEDSIVFPDSLQSIGQYAFVDCNNLSYIYFSDNSKLKTITSSAFRNCGAITTLHLPAALESIEASAFAIDNYNSYGSLSLVIPEKVTQIGSSAFYGRRTLKQVAFPNSLKKIESSAFASCYGLETLSFPTSLQTIGDRAFQSCSGLQELRVPSTLLSVGDYAFSGCSSIKKVYTYTVEPVSINQNTFSCWQVADLYVPTTSYYTYYYNTQWSQFLSLKEFDEEYTYFYINNDYELGGETGTIDGKPDADLNENSGLIITGDDTQEVGVITISGDDSGAASIIACENTLLADSLVINLVTKKGNWSYFCFPFDVLLDQLSFAHQYVIREYNGATRAQYGAGGWVNMVGDMLQKGLGYIFQGAKTDTLSITIPNPKFGCENYEQVIQAFNSSNAIHANWNFIGNPFPSWYDLDVLFDFGFSSPVYIWNGTDYQVYKPGDDEYHFHPYEGFFTQTPGNTSMSIIWGSDGRETKTQADNKHRGNSASARTASRHDRQASSQRKLINLQLASDDYTDNTRVVFNEAANMDYELGVDAVMMDGGNAPLHIWSIAPDNSRLAINERPYATGQVNLGYQVSEDGFYVLSATRMDAQVIIYDNELNQEVDLSLGNYTFYSEAGTNSTRFAISRIKQQEEVATDITDADNDADELVNVYTLLGVKLMDNVRRSDIRLGAGIYVIEHTNGTRSELTIK